MELWSYYANVLVPANAAVSQLRRAGLFLDQRRLAEVDRAWGAELAAHKALVEGEAAKRGMTLKYSEADSIHPATLAKFLYSAQGLGLEPTGQRLAAGETPSTADEFLQHYASIKVPRAGDHPVVYAVMKIRSLQGGRAKWLRAWRDRLRPDGAIHTKYNWALRTSRLSCEDPQVQNIPERADKVVAQGIKSCIVPREGAVHLTPDVEAAVAAKKTGAEQLDVLAAVWDPRKHGSVWRWDISGAEACIRAAMLTWKYCARPDPIAYEYLREGKDIHSKTASLLYGVPEGTYKKGTHERDTVGKQTFFLKIFGGSWRALQGTLWNEARMLLPDDEAKRLAAAFDAGYTGLAELYEWDQDHLGRLGYCQDGYGRRRWVGLPEGVRYLGRVDGKPKFQVGDKRLWGPLSHNFHKAANTPTQSMNATDCLWMIALLHHGEYVQLAVPPMWEARGLLFPEAAGWRLHGGSGPGGKPFRSWHSNTVHDSGWGDCAPGYLEPTAMLVYRRCTALPFDWRLEADVPYRVDFSVGPHMGLLFSYNDVARKFGLTELPKI